MDGSTLRSWQETLQWDRNIFHLGVEDSGSYWNLQGVHWLLSHFPVVNLYHKKSPQNICPPSFSQSLPCSDGEEGFFIFFSSVNSLFHYKCLSRSKHPKMHISLLDMGQAFCVCALGRQSSNIFSRSAKFLPELFKTNKQTISFFQALILLHRSTGNSLMRNISWGFCSCLDTSIAYRSHIVHTLDWA